MCQECAGPEGTTRRDVLARAGGLALGLAALAACGRTRVPTAMPVPTPILPATDRPTVEVIPGLHVHPRAAWGDDLPPTGPMAGETVEFLLVHHTASPNDGGDPRLVIRQAYAWHTSAQKGWPDVCYHFFVGHDGSIWEGRAGSIDGPVVADATGGNQGWAQLVCLIGDFTEVPPTEAAQESLVRVLAWLRWRYRLPMGVDATTTYESRGSDRHPAGAVVTTPVISPHRAATHTTCPGDAAIALLPAWRQRILDIPEPDFPHTGPFAPAERLGRADADP